MKKGLWLIIVLLAAAAVYLAIENRKLKDEIAGNKELFSLVQRELQYKDELLAIADAGITAKKPEEKITPEPGKSLKINGEFLGWNGATIFELDDGSVYQQAVHDVYFFKAQNPEVTVSEDNGSISLYIKGTDRPVTVKRIR